MQPLLQSAQLKPDVTITSADSDNEADESDDDRFFPPSLLNLILHVMTMVGRFSSGYDWRDGKC